MTPGLGWTALPAAETLACAQHRPPSPSLLCIYSICPSCAPVLILCILVGAGQSQSLEETPAQYCTLSPSLTNSSSAI